MKKEEKIKEINKYYNLKKRKIFDSFLISCIAGLLTAILIALLLGQQPKEMFQRLGLATISWGITFIVFFSFFYLLLMWVLVFYPKRKALKQLTPSKNMEKRRNGIGLWGKILTVGTIPMLLLLIYFQLFNTAFKVAITMGLLVGMIYIQRLKVLQKDYDKIENISQLCELKLNKFQNWYILLLSMGVATLTTGLVAFDKNYGFTWVGIIMILFAGWLEKYQVEPRYKKLEKYYSKIKANMID